MPFRKLTEKEKSAIEKHKKKYGAKHAQSMRAYIMRGESIKKAHEKALEAKPRLSEKKSNKRVKKLKDEGYEVKEVETESGDIAVLKRKK